MSFLMTNLGPPAIYLPSRKWRSAEAPDVVLTPGLFLGSKAMVWLGKHLEERNLRCAIPRLGGMLGYMQTKSVHGAGRRMAEYLQSLPKDCKPWVVGHSLGGMISRYAIQEAGCADRISGLITLGTPHRGTPMAFAGLGLGVGLLSWAPWQLTPYSRIIRTLNNKPWPANLPLVAVVSPSDLLCLAPRGEPPFQDGRLVRVAEFPGLGHTELLWHRDVMDYVAHTIQTGGQLREVA